MTYNIPAQVVYEIPDVIQVGLNSGILVQYGNIVRDLSGYIVKHLKTIPLGKDVSKNALIKIKDLAKSAVKDPKLLAVILALITTLFVLVKLNKKSASKGKQIEVPESVVIFNENLKLYLESLKNGENDLEILDKLIESIERLQKEEIDYIVETNIINFSELLQSIRKYTEGFAKVNDYKYDVKTYKAYNIIDLNNCLKLQKKIINKKAS